MKFWLAKNSEISVREQIVTQIVLAIASGDLTVGERLPSTREIALRYRVHANTVSHAYQILAARGWLEFRKGSGFYVRATTPREKGEKSLDDLIFDFFQTARRAGFSAAEVKARLLHYLAVQPSKNLFVVEDDLDLRAILIDEIESSTGRRATGLACGELYGRAFEPNAVFVSMFDEREAVSKLLPSSAECVFLQARSAAASMAGETRPTDEELIAVASGWDDFLMMAKTMLVAAKLDPETILLRSTREENWRKGLLSAAMIICDSLAAKKIPGHKNVRVFRLVADDSVEELKNALAADF